MSTATPPQAWARGHRNASIAARTPVIGLSSPIDVPRRKAAGPIVFADTGVTTGTFAGIGPTSLTLYASVTDVRLAREAGIVPGVGSRRSSVAARLIIFVSKKYSGLNA